MDKDKVFPDKPNALREIFGRDKVIIGMVHCKPLPGSPHYQGNMKEAIDTAIKDAQVLEEAGFDGIQLENAWDIPFSNPRDLSFETSAAMATVATEVRQEVSLPMGINVLANGALVAIAVAASCDLKWIRCNQWANAYIANEGFVEGASARTLRYRSFLKADKVKIFADVHVKHGSHTITSDRSVEEQTLDNVFFDADVLIATGSRTGDETKTEEISTITSVSKLPVIVGSGLTAENVGRILPECDGAIVGTSLKEDGKWWNPVSFERAQRLMVAVRSFRGL